jgi:hypothetical protein
VRRRRRRRRSKAEAVSEVDRVPMNLPHLPQVSVDLPQVHLRNPSYYFSFQGGRWWEGGEEGRSRGGGGVD